jgi:hypothetical protein
MSRRRLRAYVQAYDVARRQRALRERLPAVHAEGDQAWGERVQPLAIPAHSARGRLGVGSVRNGARWVRGCLAGRDARDRDPVEDVWRCDGAVWVAGQAGLEFWAAGGGSERFDRVPLGDVDEGGAAGDPAMELR